MDATDSITLLTQPDAQPPPPLSSAQTWNLLQCFTKFMGWQDVDLIDIEELHAIACDHLPHLQDLSPVRVAVTIARNSLPVDSIALVFAALALGACATADLSHGVFFFSMSSEIVKHFVGHPTLDLCVAYFLQHVFALRSGTSNYAQGIIAQAVQAGQALGLHENSCGIMGCELFLLIYMADQ